MSVWTAPPWSDYALLDFGHGQRLERFGTHTLARPDKNAQTTPQLPESEWRQAEAVFVGPESGTGNWQKQTGLPTTWQLSWGSLRFAVALTPFKHTGIFPEQSVQWSRLQKLVTSGVQTHQSTRVLNLFCYTGLASLAVAAVGASVVSVDASKPALNWHKQNQLDSNLAAAPVRIILEDALKFATRELKRGNQYEMILLDPPAYGNGPHGEKWQFQKHFSELLKTCVALLSPKARALVINTYAEQASVSFLQHQLSSLARLRTGTTEVGTLGLATQSGRVLPTGNYVFWQAV